MLIKLYEENPNQREIEKVLEVLRSGGIIIYPTDTVYGIGCDITNARAVEKVAQYKNVKIEKSNMSFICSDLSHLSDYAKPISNSIFKLLKRNLPGPFTFILEANSNVPKYFKGKKKTVGIRVPDNNIIREIVRQLGNPILSTSIHDEDEVLEYTTDPELIHEKFENFADLVIDGGFGDNIPSTVIDCTSDIPEITRQGKGELEE
ncbi:L-threonylcarbamoyladenylate synthase [Sunxiuqinia elliptica]|uniref:tRNA threonylcarbamoyl adenosine modification protein, Sua5/YciO/YrdC/YwlC family n=1 Tax=Sunxiuqinia elliptica TaxID=655355 RepID=A0A1I2I3B8_9BACT|nr:L-threonylcarbamoyladenylate synthase [Sunxiuqinia elliptica]SFF36113.1 tRNA threonylcarbamoyl adenosine modification protein, Sua5/YciO/YrdC/YwlC family [Sunxiuqinia elliptica]